MTMRRWAVRAAPMLALPVAAIAAGQAQAGGFGLREQSSYYQGTAFAGDAAGGAGLASMFWNPAAMSFSPGLAVEQNITYIAPHASIDVYSATNAVGTNLGNLGVGDIVDNGTLPSGYASYSWDNKWAVGLAVTSPYGLITDAQCGWSGRYYGCYNRIFDVNVQGSIAYRVNEWLTLGAGVNVNYIDAKLTNAQFVSPVPPQNNLYAQVNGDDIGIAYNLGALFTLAPGTTLGIGYRSGTNQNLDGDLAISLANIVTLQQVPASAAIDLPAQVTASFRSQIDPKWTVLGTVEWTDWSSIQQIVVKALGVQPVSTIDLKWNDGWFFSGGVEYQWDPKLALRAGIAYELTPVPDSTRSPRLPDTNRLWLSAGMTYNFTNQLSMDFAYSHIFGETAPIMLTQLDPANLARGNLIGQVTDGYVDIVSVALRYKFDPSTVVLVPR